MLLIASAVVSMKMTGLFMQALSYVNPAEGLG